MAEPFVQLPAVEVRYHGHRIGAAALDPDRHVPVFEYAPDWIDRGEDLAPLVLPLSAKRHVFFDLANTSFRGIPGLVADSLPGAFANLLTNAWLARHGIQPGQISVIDRLGYVGERGVGALTFHPSIREDLAEDASVIDLSRAVTAARSAISGTLQPHEAGETLKHLLDSSGSAGGARAKASVALGPNDEVRSGQHDAPEGYSHWLLKFDVARGQQPGSSTGYGQLEYAYHLMAVDAGLQMTDCKLLEADGLTHFLTRRFDRPGPSARLHVQSFAAMAHLPPENPGGHSYEQFLQTCIRLGLDTVDRSLAFRQMVFNIAAAVRDDHTKNFAFLYENEQWRLAPAFDLTFPFLDDGGWLPHHQLTVDGSVDGAPVGVLLELAERAKVPDGPTVIGEVLDAVGHWPEHAEQAGVLPNHVALVTEQLRLTALAP